MATIAVLTDIDDTIVDFVKKADDKLQKSPFIQKGYATYYRVITVDKVVNVDKYLVIAKMGNYSKNIPLLIGALLFCTIVIFLGISWWLIAPMVIASFNFFTSDTFVWLLFKEGVKKAGYRKPMKRVHLSEAIELMGDLIGSL